jgi:lipid A disaccharide synthetase
MQVGTNTAELGSLGIPMLIVLPTHALEMFKGAKGGVVGLLAAIPGWIGATVAHSVNLAVLKSAGFISWPNRWAGEEVVPELIGKIEPVEVAAMAADYLKVPARLQSMHRHLLSLQQRRLSVTGQPGAAHMIACIVEQLLRS